ncbi:hypothetical protein E1A91_A01G162600v1 [Gossypium mustelinum]|uniref:B box-type domain-containing protein n=1 Tax=Gossypium mustelinum TaxID=34275 RepID=A0A5D3AHG5_GOSMU|nr:hypothetical protein E1A91_A01G162600v1 [Gossypium mustelinum]
MRKTLAIQKLQASKTQQQKICSVVPPWLIVMYNSIFFRNCVTHRNAKKNELDRFCIHCLQSFCSHCLPAHAFHKQLKIRRYVYSDVINRQDLCKLFNCAGIQTYHTNKAKVVFLKQRSRHQQQSNSMDYCCTICNKSLQDNLLYCSIACKVLDICGDDEPKLGLPLTRKPRLRRSRKGVPLRAPMF